MSWIPFHEELRKGSKRGLPRAVRFVYLELAQEARSYQGRIPLPRGFKDDVDAVHDMIGGNRREVALALDVLTQPDDDGRPMIAVEGERGRRVLVVVSFDRWTKVASSAERMRRLREMRSQTSHDVTGRCDVTCDESRTSQVTPTEQYITNRTEHTAQPDAALAAPERTTGPNDPEQVELVAAPPDAASTRKTRGKGTPSKRSETAKGTRMTPDWTPGFDVDAWAREQGIGRPMSTLDEFRDYWLGVAGVRGLKCNWDATFRNRLRTLRDEGRLPPPDPEPEPLLDSAPKLRATPPPPEALAAIARLGIRNRDPFVGDAIDDEDDVGT